MDDLKLAAAEIARNVIIDKLNVKSPDEFNELFVKIYDAVYKKLVE